MPKEDSRNELVGAIHPNTAAHGIPGLIRDQCRRSPDAIACADEQRSLSYTELDRLSDAMADRITGATRGARGAVAIRLARGVDLVVGLLGILKARCWYLPIGLAEPESRVARMAALAGPLAVVGTPGVGLGVLPEVGVPTVADPSSAPRALAEVDADDPVYVLFTSGSTGEPKGVQLGSGALVNRLLWMQRTYQLRAEDRVLQKTPYTFDVSGWEFFWPLIAGACCVLAPQGAERDFDLLAETIRRERITVCHFVPSVLDEFLRQAGNTSGATLRHVFCSGEALSSALARRFLDVSPAHLHNLYGPTEAAIDVTQWTVPRTLDAEDKVLIGAPVDNTVLRVAAEHGAPGELWIAGTQLALGYVGRPDLTARAFPVVDGTRYYRTGDLVRMVADQLEYLGRIDDQVKVRGVRVEPGEIEHVLRQHDAVRQAAVVPVGTDATGGVELVAAFTPRAQPPSAEQLRGFVADRLPAAYVPVGFHQVDALPLTGSGKLDRSRLRTELAGWWQGSAGTAADPGDDISRLWWLVLARPDEDLLERGFLQLGGHSLLAARLIGLLREELGVHLPITVLLRDNASLAEVRRMLATADRDKRVELSRAPGLRSPLSPGQRWLWLASRMWPEAGAYNVVTALRLDGPVRTDLLRAALADALKRHDVLRARVVMVDGEPEFRYASTVSPQWTIGTSVAEIAAQPISMSEAPMLRAGLVVDDDGSCLVLSLHHLVADQRSVDIVLADLASAYRARTAGEIPRDEPAPSFAAYAEAETRQVGGARWSAAVDYWRRTFADAPTSTQLPFTTPPSSSPSFAGRRHRRRLGPVRTRPLMRFCRENAVTPGVLVLTCLAVVVAKWTGQDTVVLGMPSSRRRGGAEDDLVGFLVDTLAIRVDVADEPGFDTVLRRVWERYTEALEQHTPSFAEVVAELGMETRPTVNPFFQIWVNDLSHAEPPPDFAGLRASVLDLPDPPALFDLNLYLSRDADGYRIDLVRAVDRVAAEVVDELLEQVVAALDQALEHAPTPWADLLAVRSVPPNAPDPVVDPVGVLDAIARQSPSAKAVRSGRSLTYGQLAAETARTAEQLVERGVATGSVVLVQARRTPELISSLLGVWRAGGVPAIVDCSPRARQDVDFRELLRPAAVLEITGDGVRVAEGVAEHQVLPDAGHILFTSGSGGTPAPVVVPKRALGAFLAWYVETFGIADMDRTGLLAGLGHDPVLRDICAPLVVGGSVVVPSEDVFDSPVRLFRFVAESELTVLHATPALLELMIAGAREAGGARFRSLRLVVSGGAPLPAGLVSRLRQITDAQLVNAYGTTETPQIVCCQVVDDSDLVPVGRGCAGNDVVVLAASGRPAAVGELGEIVVRGPHLASGYLDGRHPERFGVDADVRVFRTGDLGRLDPWGRVHVGGRADRQVQVNGHRIALEDIEHAASRHRAVVRARAEHRRSTVGDVLDLRVVLDAGVVLDADELRRHLRSLLPAHAVPARVSTVSTLDTDANHKVRVRVGGTGYRTEWVERLDALIRQELSLRIGPEQNLFDAGLNSVTLVRLHARWQEDIGHDVAITALFANPTLGALDRELQGRRIDAPAVRRTDVRRLRAAGEIRGRIRRRIYQDSGGPQ